LGTGHEHGEAPSPREAAGELQQRLQWATQCEIALPSSLLHYPGASVGVVFIDPAHTTPDQALEQADAAMYQVKRARRTAALH
ncbi:MAG: diguanylate cyclase, partial [Acidovorax sp.]|nr:diguanylate cyclase [Acidovorax sp.]